MNDVQRDIYDALTSGDYSAVEFDLSNGKTITGTRDGKSGKWAVTRGGDLIAEDLSDEEARSKLVALAGGAVRLPRLIRRINS